ncbi:ketopantoate reductase family protein [bacterium]|nr:ketopantoate reductase family protein [bacterium]
MKEIKNVLICGIGAIGSIYADKIHKKFPKNLKILVDKKRFDRYQNSPVIFNGEALKLNYTLPENKDFKADLIIIATKFDGLEDAIKNIKNFVDEDTVILSLLNGITSEEIIAKNYGAEKILYSYYIGNSAIRKGNIITHDGVCTIVFGAKEENKNVKRVQKFFEKAGINYEIPEDIIHSLWKKYLLNVSTNQPSAILRMTFGQMQKNSKFRVFMENIMLEVIELAKASGVKNADTLLDEALENFNLMSPEGKTSMLQDVESGRKTEVKMFAQTIVELGQKYNIQTPYNMVLLQMLEIIQENIELTTNEMNKAIL